MSIVRTDVPMTPALCEKTIAQLVSSYPFAHTETLITTAFNRPVRSLTVGRGGRRVLFTAAHHANEWITATLLLKFAEELCEAIAFGGELYGIPGRLFERNVTICMVPMVNPDGVALVTGELTEDAPGFDRARKISEDFPVIPFPDGWKANLLGVDLNLQYPAGWLTARTIKFSQGYNRPAPRDFVGTAPLTQRECIALVHLTKQISPALVLAFHTQGRVIYWQFRGLEVPGAEALASEFGRLSGYSVEDTPESSAYAGFKDWFIQRYKRPGFTIEVGQGTNPLPLSQFEEIYRDNLGILTTAALGLPTD